MDHWELKYMLKLGSGHEPTEYLGSEIRWHTIPNLGNSKPWSRCDAGTQPTVSKNYFQGLNGVLRWAIELGWVDIITMVALLSHYLTLPWEGHLEKSPHVIAYLKAHGWSNVFFHDTTLILILMDPFKVTGLKCTKRLLIWSRQTCLKDAEIISQYPHLSILTMLGVNWLVGHIPGLLFAYSALQLYGIQRGRIPPKYLLFALNLWQWRRQIEQVEGLQYNHIWMPQHLCCRSLCGFTYKGESAQCLLQFPNHVRVCP